MFVYWNNLTIILVIFLVSNFILSYISSKFLIFIGKKFKILDSKNSDPSRKEQIEDVPLLGATGFVFFSLLLTGVIWINYKKVFDLFGLDYAFISNSLKDLDLNPLKFFWICLAFLIILISGFFDDIYKFKSKIVFFPTLISLLIIIFLGEIRIDTISSSFYSYIPNDYWIKSLITFIWLGLCLSATKFLDGMDGLVSISGIIGFLIIAATTSLAHVNQPLIFFISLIWVFGVLGFLPNNLPNAKLYLGEAGSQIIGLTIGILSIVSGAKIATALTILGWFILDLILVMLTRIFILRKNPLNGDKLHWHYRMLALGLNKSQVLFVTTCVLVITGIFGVILPTSEKIYLLLIQIDLSILFFILTTFLTWEKIIPKNK